MSINNQLPYLDVVPHIASYCDPRTILSLGCACKEVNNYSEMQRKIFNVKYGALASFETDVASVVEKIKKLEDTDAYLSSPDTQENPSFFEKIKKRYELFCGSQVKSAVKKIMAVFEEHKKIYEEFEKMTLTNYPNPLQEHAHRCIRLFVIKKHEEELLKSFEKIQENQQKFYTELSFFEKIAFCTILYFRKDKDNNGYNADFTQTFSILSFNLFVQRRIILSELTVVLENEAVPIKIVGHFNGIFDIDNYKKRVLSDYLSFSIIPSDKPYRGTHDLLGRIAIQNKAGNILLVVNSDDYVGQDDTTGDIPISRLLVQMIMEIFTRTNCNRVKATIENKTILVCAAGGMRNTRKDENEHFLEDIKRARAKRKLFPIAGTLLHNRYTHYQSTQEIWKSEKRCPGAATHFVCGLTEDEQLIPALVDFELQGSPRTWEELIEKQPLLGKGGTPILPELADRWVRKRLY
jgi:hypothetical protein